ncbi:P-loop containing nucleoside triphosphate hydrolase protein [Apiospora arundinis]
MRRKKPPSSNRLLLFPHSIPAINLRRKTWLHLHVDHMLPITWNKQAFADLVVDDETKELVQAPVMKQIAVLQTTDFIGGKGSGLIVLLHGGPGTGKTFTAEGVAEFTEKPLLRVTCGDVGTKAEEVEKKLQSSFNLGKIWDCVVLLDEADVFLEERDMKDLNRNALVSVFLRELEYHDGILILTSNRVGTFDEAFKSRIQLSLHYENLGISQRRKVWRNFMNRVKSLDPTIDYDDIIDHIEDLSMV